MSNMRDMDNEALALMVSMIGSFVKWLPEKGVNSLVVTDDETPGEVIMYTLTTDTMFDCLQEAKRRLEAIP